MATIISKFAAEGSRSGWSIEEVRRRAHEQAKHLEKQQEWLKERQKVDLERLGKFKVVK